MPADDLARVVLGHVLEVEDRLVDAGAAVDDVALAVADGDAVVAGAAPDGVALHVAAAVHVLAAQREQPVVAVAALGGVLPLVGEHDVVPGAAVLAVVARAS